MARNDPQINIRLPKELKSEIDKASKNNNRSMNAEIVARLGKSFEHENLHDVAQYLEGMKKLQEKRIAEAEETFEIFRKLKQQTFDDHEEWKQLRAKERKEFLNERKAFEVEKTLHYKRQKLEDSQERKRDNTANLFLQTQLREREKSLQLREETLLKAIATLGAKAPQPD